MTTLHYYVIGDPLNLFSVFVPDRNMVDFCDAMVLARLYLAGLTFSFFAWDRYLKPSYIGIREAPVLPEMVIQLEMQDAGGMLHTSGISDKVSIFSALLAGAFIYIFSSYTLVFGMHHQFFLNPLIDLPLLLLGVEKILKKQSPVLFTGMVVVSAVTNFYFFYLLGCNVIIYVIIRLCMIHRGSGIFGMIKKIFMDILRIAVYTLTGIFLSAPLLIPVVRLFLRAERSSGSSTVSLLYDNSYYKELLSAFVTPGAVHPHTVMGFSFVAILCIFLLFMDRRKYTGLKVRFICMTVFVCLPLAGKIMNGFSYASNRWMFGYALLVACIVSAEWKHMFFLKKGELVAAAVALCFMIAALFTGIYKEGETGSLQLYVLCFLIAGLGIMFIAGLDEKKRYIKRYVPLLCMLVFGSVCINANYCFGENGKNKVTNFQSVETVKNYLVASTERALKKVVEEEEDFYRYAAPAPLVEKNSTLQSGLSSTNYYWSLADGLPQQYFVEMGLDTRQDYNYKGLEDRTILNTLASVKYYVTDQAHQSSVPYGYEKTGSCKVDTENGEKKYIVYENQYALPLGYTYDSYIDRDSYEQLNEIEKEDTLLQSVLLEEEKEDYADAVLTNHVESVDWEIVEAEHVTWDGYTFDVKKAKSKVTIHLSQSTAGQETGLLLKGLQYNSSKQSPKEIKIKFSHKLSDGSVIKKSLTYITPSHLRYEGRTDYYVNLGWSAEESGDITITFPKTGEYTLDSLNAYVHSLEDYADEVEERKGDVLENIEIGTNRITGEINLSEEKILCLSIPYSTGWTAYVDGKKTELLEANTMFMALLLSTGEHQIVLTYQTPGSEAGFGFFFLGWIMLIFLYGKRRNGSMGTTA
ncbi:MAG: YfhO family protein [Clostridiales bacterium]|nr:YfhO family protein [Clostridiales bacterium]